MDIIQVWFIVKQNTGQGEVVPSDHLGGNNSAMIKPSLAEAIAFSGASPIAKGGASPIANGLGWISYGKYQPQ